MNITIDGEANVPRTAEPLIVISNHFSWFDAPLLALCLPFQPAFLVATESQRKWWVRAFILLFNGIPIWRGQVDRAAFQKAVQALNTGQVVGVFPEGGINPELADLVARGQVIPELRGNTSRASAKLVRPRSGTALLAVMSKAHILPVGLIGTERILNNLHNWRARPLRCGLGLRLGRCTLIRS
ncbi:MAG: lysophospholipid acyltransferase family protein [Caldilineaceae bacterium]